MLGELATQLDSGRIYARDLPDSTRPSPPFSQRSTATPPAAGSTATDSPHYPEYTPEIPPTRLALANALFRRDDELDELGPSS